MVGILERAKPQHLIQIPRQSNNRRKANGNACGLDGFNALAGFAVRWLAHISSIQSCQLKAWLSGLGAQVVEIELFDLSGRLAGQAQRCNVAGFF